MNMHKKIGLMSAAVHLLDSASFYTKDAGGDPLDVLAKKFGDHVSEVMTKLGANNNQLKAMKEQLAELGQKAERTGPGGGDPEPETLGKQFVDSERFTAFVETGAHHSKGAKLDFNIKASLTSLTTDAAGSVGAAASPAYRDGFVLKQQRRLAVRDLMPVIQITSNAVEVPVQKGRNNNAGMVAEGAAKPSSDIQFELKNFSPRVIAHWMKASKQILDDAPQLKGLIDSELIYGLKLKEEIQLLSGDGTGQNLLGMVPQATAYVAPVVIGDTNMLDVLALAALQVALADYEADGVIIHPSDWLQMRLLKDSTGQYIYGPPGVVVEPRAFGLPLVPTPSMTASKFLVGQYQVAATVYDRWEARVEVGYENDDFTKNMVTILGEERLAFAVKRPGALVYGDFNDALGA